MRRFNETGSGHRATSVSLTTVVSAYRGGVDATPSSLFGPTFNKVWVSPPYFCYVNGPRNNKKLELFIGINKPVAYPD